MHLRGAALIATVLALAGLSACSVGGGDGPPQVRVGSDDEEALEKLGFPSTASRNTTRVAGADAMADAAGVATAVFPATSEQTRPSAVVLVGEEDWQGALAAASLTAAPLRAPILLSGSDELPPATAQAIERLDPKGAELARGAQVIRIGDVPSPAPELRTERVRGEDPYEAAAAVDRLASAARGEPSDDVVIASGERPEFATPAGAWAAHSGDSVLLTQKDTLPEATKRALEAHERPNIYLLGPPSVIGPGVEKELSKLGRVRRVGAPSPVQNAIEFARFEGSDFGWGIKVPGYNLTLASTARPMDVAAAAALATNGVFAPLLLTDRAEELPDPLESYLLDIQPGYQEDPRQGVYNRVWLLGDVETISPQVQGRLDELTELIPVEPEPAADRRSGGGGQDGDAAPGGGGGPPGPPAAPGGGGPGGRGPGSGPGPGNSR